MTKSASSSISVGLTGDKAILARRYAEALYGLATSAGQLDAVADEMRGLKELLHQSKDMSNAVANPLLSRLVSAKVMKSVSDTLSLSPLVSNFIALLARNRRLSLLEGTVDAYLALLREARNEHVIEVTSAKPLSPAQEGDLVTQLEQVTGGKVFLNVKLNADLLGGLIIKMGSRQIDASLRGKLARLERHLKSQREAA